MLGLLSSGWTTWILWHPNCSRIFLISFWKYLFLSLDAEDLLNDRAQDLSSCVLDHEKMRYSPIRIRFYHYDIQTSLRKLLWHEDDLDTNVSLLVLFTRESREMLKLFVYICKNPQQMLMFGRCFIKKWLYHLKYSKFFKKLTK